MRKTIQLFGKLHFSASNDVKVIAEKYKWHWTIFSWFRFRIFGAGLRRYDLTIMGGNIFCTTFNLYFR